MAATRARTSHQGLVQDERHERNDAEYARDGEVTVVDARLTAPTPDDSTEHNRHDGALAEDRPPQGGGCRAFSVLRRREPPYSDAQFATARPLPSWTEDDHPHRRRRQHRVEQPRVADDLRG